MSSFLEEELKNSEQGENFKNSNQDEGAYQILDDQISGMKIRRTFDDKGKLIKMEIEMETTKDDDDLADS